MNLFVWQGCVLGPHHDSDFEGKIGYIGFLGSDIQKSI